METTGWMIQERLGAEGWYVTAIPGGHQRGQPFSESAIWHEHKTKEEALTYLLERDLTNQLVKSLTHWPIGPLDHWSIDEGLY